MGLPDRQLSAQLDDLDRRMRELERSISLAPLPVKGATAAGVEEAPEDGTPYARQDAGWVAISAAAVPTGAGLYLVRDGAWVEVTVVSGVTVCIDGSESTVDLIVAPSV